MHASQQKRFERHEVTSFNNTIDKMANNHKTNSNQNGELVEKEQVEVEFQTIDGNVVDKDTEIERVKKIEEDITANGEAGNQHTSNKMEANTNVEQNQRAENKLENTARARNIQNEDIKVENTIEEITSQNESITIENTKENVQKEGVMLRNSIAGRNIQQAGIVKENEVEHKGNDNFTVNADQENDIQQAGIVKENEVEHKDNENFTVNADQENDIQQETTDEIFVVEDKKTDSRINYTVNERYLLQRNMVSDTDVGIEANKRINVANDEEKLLEMSDLGGEHEVQQERKDLKNVTDNNKTVGTNKNCEIIFRNPDTGLLSTAGQFNREDFVSDGSESEFSSSEETGSSDESCDSHVPVSCKDFDNVLEAYLKDNAAGSSNTGHLTSESRTLNQSLKSTQDAKDANDVDLVAASNNAIHANETQLPSEMNSNVRAQRPFSQLLKSRIAKEENDHKPTRAQGGVVYANESRPLPTVQNPAQSAKSQISNEPAEPQGNGIYANEPGRSFGTETNNGSNSEETMFYGATSDDVTAYMAALPTEWTNTWYRVYDRQTNFIMKYTKFCQENF